MLFISEDISIGIHSISIGIGYIHRYNYIGQYKHKLQNIDRQNVLNKQNTNNEYNFFLERFLYLYNETFATNEHKTNKNLSLFHG